jgi:TPR repeat protein
MYAKGQGVPQDHAEAVKWFRKAADQGVAQAQSYLGAMYAKGQGVPQDYVEAYKWFDLAAARFAASDAVLRDGVISDRQRIAADMTPAQVAEAQRLAREWKPE